MKIRLFSATPPPAVRAPMPEPTLEPAVEGKDFSFPAQEEKILELWKQLDAFKTQLKMTEGMPEYSFYDGPPFATGMPHYGHILAGTIKDVVTRYASSTGHHVVRRFGWDCHGLPVEYEIDQKLGIKSKEDVMKLGIDVYNEECRSIVQRYAKEWETVVGRMGRWIDFEDDYKTLDPSFMESVWWVFKQLFEKNMVYRGFKVMPYSTTCNTPLSNFEAGLNYKDVSDPAVMVSFPLKDDPDGAAMVAWTTTPWTLPSNVALCVHPDFKYIKVKDPATGKVYVVAESRLSALPGAMPTAAKKGKAATPGFERVAEMVGKDLLGKVYEPLFPYFSDMSATAFRVCNDTYVTDDSGTGIVHQAPAFGEDDYRVCIAHGIIAKGQDLPCPVDDNGCFTEVVVDFAGQYVKEADKHITKKIKEIGRLVNSATLVHSYPFCWRSDTPLIYRAVPSWFVKVEQIRDQICENNLKTYWVPSVVQEKRFHNWLTNAHDWAVSRTRYWGTPLPVWTSEDLSEVVCIGSIEELERLSGRKVTDLHRHFIDDIEIPSQKGGAPLRRVVDVFDCWFESGSMPYAQLHYPFENKERFEKTFPADFIAEGLDQTRGWFYTLMVLSTALFGKPAFKNLICNGLVLASDGKKMSKRLKNYPDPMEVVSKYGADALRLYLINSPVVRAEALAFKEAGVFAVVKDVFLPWYNAYRFFVQNALRYCDEHGAADFSSVDLSSVDNVLDRWILAALNTLIRRVEEEMEAYRLYNVVPRLLTFIEQLTNIYVRFNRKRLKGSKGPEDCLRCALDRMGRKMGALGTLYHVLMTLCKAMAPCTPFFTESMYQNLRNCQPGAELSVHFCSYPKPPKEAEDMHIQTSVARMQTVIDLARNIREKHSKPVKLPLKKMVVVHKETQFLADMQGELMAYVLEELNIRELETCADPDKYSTVKAEPQWNVLGKRLGKSMGAVAGAMKKLTSAQLASYEQHGALEVGGFPMGPGDIKVVREFKMPEDRTAEEVDAGSDGDVLVMLELVQDQALVEAGLAREIVNKFQKMRKSAGLTPGQVVECFVTYEGSAEEKASLQSVITAQAAYISESLGTVLIPEELAPAHLVPLLREKNTLSTGISFMSTIAHPTVCPNPIALQAACNGDTDRADGLRVWLASRDPALLQAEANESGVAVTVDGVKTSLQVNEHFFMSTVGLFNRMSL